MAKTAAPKKPLTKSALLANVAAATELSKKQVAAVLEALTARDDTFGREWATAQATALAACASPLPPGEGQGEGVPFAAGYGTPWAVLDAARAAALAAWTDQVETADMACQTATNNAQSTYELLRGNLLAVDHQVENSVYVAAPIGDDQLSGRRGPDLQFVLEPAAGLSVAPWAAERLAVAALVAVQLVDPLVVGIARQDKVHAAFDQLFTDRAEGSARS